MLRNISSLNFKFYLRKQLTSGHQLSLSTARQSVFFICLNAVKIAVLNSKLIKLGLFNTNQITEPESNRHET